MSFACKNPYLDRIISVYYILSDKFHVAQFFCFGSVAIWNEFLNLYMLEELLFTERNTILSPARQSMGDEDDSEVGGKKVRQVEKRGQGARENEHRMAG